MSSKYTKDSLDFRMKEYEVTSQNTLLRRTPVIIRIDGKAFHTYTKFLRTLDPALNDTTPFSTVMHDAMMFTTQMLVDNVQTCVIGYTQSDEISLVLKDWTDLSTQQWFGGNVQKLTSISASIATAAFNHKIKDVRDPSKFDDLALFDARAYNLPVGEVTNYLIWRQQDASRNSIQMLGRHYFTQKQMHGKSNSEIQDMLISQHGVNWNDLSPWMRRGACVTRDDGRIRTINNEPPIFTQNREYIENRLLVKPQDE